jgi:PKD repeat protein
MRKIYYCLFLLLATALSVQSQTFSYSDTWGKNGFNLVDSKSNAVQVVFSVPTFSMQDQVINGTVMKNISMPGTFLFNDAGMPNLPGEGKFIAIPTGSTPKVRIISQRTETMHNVEVAPAPVIPLDNDDRPLIGVPNTLVYSTNAFYPESPVKISEVSQIRGVDAVILGVTPFQYNPITKDLVVYKDLKVEVTFEGGNGQFGNEAYRNIWWDPILQDNLLNYAALPVVDYNARLQSLNKSARTDECEYIIITPTGSDFLAWADTIRKFRTEQGILTKVFTLTEVGGNTETAIEAFINDAYNNWTIKPVACLLLGDYGSDETKNIISHLYTHPDSYPNFASDNFYADVTGDEMPDVVFARIAANNASQLKVMCSKFLSYERNPPVNPRYYDGPITALGWQTERWFQLCSEIVGGYFKNVQGKHPRRINKVYQGNPGSIWSSATNTNTIVTYFGAAGLSYIPDSPATLGGFDGGTATQVNAAIDSGAFMLQHRDHGNYTGWGEPAYTTGNIAQLKNTDLTFVFSINCETGAYHNPSGCPSECFQEKFQRHTYNNQNSGALGLVCPSETSYSFVNDTFVWGMYDNMWPDFMPAYGTTPASRGALPAFGNAAGKYFLKQSSWPYNTGSKSVTYRLFHMHGDAFQPLYFSVPQQLTVVHDSVINYGATTFSIQTNDSALIALTLDGELLATGLGSGSGPISLTIPVIPIGSQVLVTVTKQNYFRYSDYVPVTSEVMMANFSASSNSVCSGSAVDFSDMSSGTPETWAWEFPGGTPATSNVQNPTGIAYPQSGTYDVTLTVTKAGSNPSTLAKTAYIAVTNLPVPDFSAPVGCPGQSVQFTDMTNPNGGTISSWKWNFGDPGTGSANTSLLQNPVHSYNTPGTYTVALVSTVNGMCTDSVMKEVIVTTAPEAAATPQGETNLCKDVAGKIYTTAGVTNATTYAWMIEPDSVATITGTDTIGTLTLAAGFTGTFNVKVQGINDCGSGPFSELLQVTVIDAPVAPAKPAGDDSVNLNRISTTDFTIIEVAGATSYAWTMTPEAAGTVAGIGLTGTATWDKTYRGVATLTAKAVNDCGESISSDAKTVTLYAPVGIGENAGLGIRIFPNPNNGLFTLDITSGIVSEVKITVYNILGNVVYAESGVRFNGTLHKNLDLAGLAKGVYRLTVEGNGISNSTSVVIGK